MGGGARGDLPRCVTSCCQGLMAATQTTPAPLCDRWQAYGAQLQFPHHSTEMYPESPTLPYIDGQWGGHRLHEHRSSAGNCVSAPAAPALADGQVSLSRQGAFGISFWTRPLLHPIATPLVPQMQNAATPNLQTQEINWTGCRTNRPAGGFCSEGHRPSTCVLPPLFIIQ